MRNEVFIGVDFGTSKIAVAYFSKTSEEWRQLLVADAGVSVTHDYEKYVEPSQIAFVGKQLDPLFGRAAHDAILRFPRRCSIVNSVKKCVYCEWVCQPARKLIGQDECINPANFSNQNWCDHGKANFTVNRYDWRPSALLHMLLDYTFSKTKGLLDQQLGKKGYVLAEIKLAYPMIFAKAGREHEQMLTAIVRDVARPIFRDVTADEFDVFVVEEPIASLMASGGDQAGKRIDNGFFLVVDVGAGSTDLALCYKHKGQVTIHESDSEFIAGDDYDLAVEKLLRSKSASTDGYDPDPRIVKERFCTSRAAIVVNCLAPETRKVRETITLQPAEIEKAFLPLNERIASMASNMKGIAESQNRQIRTVYMTGGGSTVPGLEDAIRSGTGGVNIAMLELADAHAAKMYDSRVTSVSMGAAFPTNRYTKLLRYSLPVNLVAKFRTVTDGREAVLYKSGSSVDSNATAEFKDIPDECRLQVFAEDIEGNRLLLNSTKVPERCHRGKMKYEIAFNGFTRLSFKPEGRRPWEIVFEGFPHTRLRSLFS
jgi:hypothetical protein